MNTIIYDQNGNIVSSSSTGGGGGGGGPAVVPNNLSPNSVTIAPIPGETQPSALIQKDGSGTTIFSSDSGGNVLANGTFKANGPANLAAVNASGLINANNGLTVGTGPTSVGALTASGLVKAPNLQLNSGGAITFGDGSTINTAAAASTVPSRAIIYAGTNNITSLPANSFQNTYFYTSTGNAGNTGFVYRFPFPGVVVGISLVNTATQSISNLIQFMKNGANFKTPYNLGVANGPGNTIPAYNWATTELPYAVGDVLTFGVGYTVTANIATEIYLVIQHTA